MNLKDELERVRLVHGVVTPATVLETATPEDDPLHNRFEWDDEVAGEKHRLRQAHDLIRSVRVVYKRDRHGPRSLRAYVPMPQVNTYQPSYEPIQDVLNDKIKRRILFNQFERDLASLEARYGCLQEYADMLRKAAKRHDRAS